MAVFPLEYISKQPVRKGLKQGLKQGPKYVNGSEHEKGCLRNLKEEKASTVKAKLEPVMKVVIFV